MAIQQVSSTNIFLLLLTFASAIELGFIVVGAVNSLSPSLIEHTSIATRHPRPHPRHYNLSQPSQPSFARNKTPSRMDHANNKKRKRTYLQAATNDHDNTNDVDNNSTPKTITADNKGISTPPPSSPPYIPPENTPLPPLTSPPILTFGVIADIQYAPIPNGKSFKGAHRYYRHALDATKHAARAFEDQGVCAVVNLGDSIDGKCQEIDKCGGDVAAFLAAGGDESKAGDAIRYEEDDADGKDPGIVAIDVVLRALSVYKSGPIYHTYGNHELYNFGHEVIQRKLEIPFVTEPSGDLVGYYTRLITPNDTPTTTPGVAISPSLSPSSSSPLQDAESITPQQVSTTSESPSSNDNDNQRKLRLVVLDCYDLSLLQRGDSTTTKATKPTTKTSPKYTAAAKLLATYNKNYPGNENSPQGLPDHLYRYVAFNGGIDTPQLTWLRQTLASAREAKETVILASHQPILPTSANPVCLLWNYPEVLDLLREYAGVVAVSFAGHAHKGGYGRDVESGIHFRVIEAALENDDPMKTFGFVDLYEDRLVVRGEGGCENAVYDFAHLEY